MEPPEPCPKYLREGLEKQSAETLEAIAEYARALAQQKREAAQEELEAEAVDDDTPDEWDDEEWAAIVEENDVPSGATLTVKTIDGRGYYYWQWRDGDTVKSKYAAPVSPKE